MYPCTVVVLIYIAIEEDSLVAIKTFRLVNIVLTITSRIKLFKMMFLSQAYTFTNYIPTCCRDYLL